MRQALLDYGEMDHYFLGLHDISRPGQFCCIGKVDDNLARHGSSLIGETAHRDTQASSPLSFPSGEKRRKVGLALKPAQE